MQEKDPKNKRGRKEYEQGFLFSLGLLIAGMLLEWITRGRGAGLPSWPVNVQIGLSFIILLVFIHIYYRELNVVKWLSRVPSAISAIALFSLLVLIMGLSRQNDPEASGILHYTGFSHVRNSYPFLLSGLYLLTSLGLVILRRAFPLNLKNAGFLMNHLGLWIIVFSGSLGAGDLQRLNIRVHENESVWFGFDDNSQIRELPFALKLIEFSIDQYNPKLAYIKKEDLSFPPGVKNNLRQIDTGLTLEIEDWEIEILELHMMSFRDSVGFYPSGDSMSVPSARLKATSKITGTEKTGWISCGSFMISPEFFELDDVYALAMTNPEPKTYNSLIEITTRDGAVSKHDLQVNKPVKVAGWTLYQLSFDERMGRWSTLSVIEAIRDPWLIVIYTGIFMVLAGALYMFWLGKN